MYDFIMVVLGHADMNFFKWQFSAMLLTFFRKKKRNKKFCFHIYDFIMAVLGHADIILFQMAVLGHACSIHPLLIYNRRSNIKLISNLSVMFTFHFVILYTK